MLPLRQLLASLLLASSAHAYVYLDDWLPHPFPTQSDTFVAVEIATSWPTSPHIFTWIAGERDSKSRLLSSTYTNVWDNGTQLMKFSFQWDFDLDYRVSPMLPKCPSRVVFEESHGQAKPKSDTDWYDWNSSSRTLLHRSSNQKLETPICAWIDSIVLDSRNRIAFQATCGEIDDASPSNIIHRQFVRYWYEDTSKLPRSASSRVPDLNWFDTLTVVGPIERPYAANRYHTDSAGTTQIIDSLEWNSRNQLVRSKVKKGYRTSIYTDEFDGDRLVRHSARYWQGDSLVDTLLDVYRYTLAGTGVSHRTASRQLARIVMANGLPHLEIDLPAPEHIHVEQISMDGKRLALLTDRNLPAGRSTLPISVKPGQLLRIHTSRGQSTLVAPPR
jgi:hypothetical protein